MMAHSEERATLLVVSRVKQMKELDGICVTDSQRKLDDSVKQSSVLKVLLIKNYTKTVDGTT